MKANNMMIKKLSLATCFLLLILAACKKKDDLEQVRLFRPVVKDALVSNGNWIGASWQPINGAVTYTAQVSRDTFRTIIASVTIDTNVYVFQNLDWDKLYQVQVRANAADTTYSSRFSNLGSIRTARFPTI
jgi:hypothetical protein